MKKSVFILSSFLILLIRLFSCTENPEIFAAAYEPKLVVEGRIENDEYAQVILTMSASFSHPLDTNYLYQNIIKSAKVSISDGENTEILVLGANNNYLPPYVYYGSNIKGEIGKSYYLTIEYKNRIITAETSIPQPVPLDSCWFVKEEPSDTTGYIRIRFSNRSDLYYQVATLIVGEETIFTPCLYGNYKSVQFNKNEPVEIEINKGPVVFPKSDFSTYFPEKEIIRLKFRTQTKEGYDFWISWQNEILNAQNPIFPAYTSLKSNINGGIGIWCGYGSFNYSVIGE